MEPRLYNPPGITRLSPLPVFYKPNYSSSVAAQPLFSSPFAETILPVLGLDIVDPSLGLLPAVVVVVAVVVVLGTDVVHLVDAAALGAPLHGAVAGHLRKQAVSSEPLRKDASYLPAAR